MPSVNSMRGRRVGSKAGINRPIPITDSGKQFHAVLLVEKVELLCKVGSEKESVEVLKVIGDNQIDFGVFIFKANTLRLKPAAIVFLFLEECNSEKYFTYRSVAVGEVLQVINEN